MEYIKRHIRDVQDFPSKGILFKDLTTAFKAYVVESPQLFGHRPFAFDVAAVFYKHFGGFHGFLTAVVGQFLDKSIQNCQLFHVKQLTTYQIEYQTLK